MLREFLIVLACSIGGALSIVAIFLLGTRLWAPEFFLESDDDEAEKLRSTSAWWGTTPTLGDKTYDSFLKRQHALYLRTQFSLLKGSALAAGTSKTVIIASGISARSSTINDLMQPRFNQEDPELALQQSQTAPSTTKEFVQ